MGAPHLLPAEHLGARDALLLLLGLPAAAVLAYPELAGRDLRIWAGTLPILLLGALVVGRVPAHWRPAAQALAAVALFLTAQLQRREAEVVLPIFAVTVGLALIATRLRLGLRPLVLGGTGIIALCGLVAYPGEELVLGAFFRFLLLAAGEPVPIAVALRYLLLVNLAAVTPAPPPGALGADLSWASRRVGLGWSFAGLPLLWVSHHADPGLDPIGTLAAGRPLAAAGTALLFWGWKMAWIAGTLLLDAGAMRLLGVPVPIPVDAPWKSKDFLDYWRRANTWRYQLLSSLWFRPFFPARGPGLSLGVFVVFVVSGLHHAVIGFHAPWIWLRWVLEGGVAAANAAWSQWRARRAVQAFLRSGTRPAPPGPAWAIAAALVVLLSHGFLMQLARPTEEMRAPMKAFSIEGFEW